VEACRAADLPCIFLHWGFRCSDGADLAPEIYRTMRDYHGEDPRKWPGHPADPRARPALAFDIAGSDYVLAKTGQDAFWSCNLRFVLQNLGVERLVFVGGHTEACLGKTAKSAKWLGYGTLCVSDATNNARESTRLKGLAEARFDVVASAEVVTASLRWSAGTKRE
jgi:nicotinamidase-related amidase